MDDFIFVIMWYFILFLFGLPVYIHGNVMDEMKERMQLCCDHGTDFAYNSTAEECSSVKVPPDLLSFASVCKYASEQCCQEYTIKKTHCERGIQLAKTSQLIMSFKENLEKNCFDQCELGAKVGKSNGIASCKVTAPRKSAEHLLISDAFFQCCKASTDAESDARDNPNKSTEKGFTLDTPIIVSSVSSMCEEYAPHDLCEHHCIPVPGSYKCECRSGYVLMSDGQSCEKVVNNRCDPRNTCQHECIDNRAVIINAPIKKAISL